MEAAERERNTTLTRMVSAHKISQKQADAAKKEPINVRPTWRRDANESYAMDAISRDLEVILEKENIELGGLTIITTIDQRLQTIAEEALDKKLRETERISGYPHQTRAAWQSIPIEQRKDPKYIQGAAVLIENQTGCVLALVGGRDANESKFNRAIQARRQIGSVFKPFVYLAAFDKGLRPNTQISDGPIRYGEIKGAANWKPHNSDGKFGDMHPVSYGLIRSRNTMSVRVGNYAGVAKVKDVSFKAGFGKAMPENPSSFLGSWEATPFTRFSQTMASVIGHSSFPKSEINLTIFSTAHHRYPTKRLIPARHGQYLKYSKKSPPPEQQLLLSDLVLKKKPEEKLEPPTTLKMHGLQAIHPH
jgi:penicillin-binding protein 1A